jgi:hypothetical protein
MYGSAGCAQRCHKGLTVEEEARERRLGFMLAFQAFDHPLGRPFMYLRYRQALSGDCNPSARITRVGVPAILTRHTRYRRTLTSLVALALVLCTLPGCGINRFPTLDEQVKAAWSEVLNQYQRRADLIPNLVQTVKGYAHQ